MQYTKPWPVPYSVLHATILTLSEGNPSMIYDVIGDIHGHADKLEGLLEQLGYTLRVHETLNINYYQPPEGNRAIFIGDLIDRGPQELQTLEIVYAMIDAGVADAVMGNHEYNALAYATLDKTALQQANCNQNPSLRCHSVPPYR